MTDTASAKADIGVTGLAVMGSNLARNFARNGFVTAVHNRSYAKTAALVEEHGGDGSFVASESAADFVASLAVPRKILIMVKAGGPTDAVIDELAGLVEPGDIIIDGGNAQFADTRRRQAALEQKGIHFVGCGVSGGEEGALNGPSIMPGGSAESYVSLGPILEKISAHVDGAPCCTHIGTDGAGHFVKMVHNGIEYADMQLIAEAYDLLRRGAGLSPAEIGGHLRRVEQGGVGFVPDRDHRAGAGPGRRGHRRAVRGRGAGRGGDEGHRDLDGADGVGSGHPGVRDRGGGVRPRACRRSRRSGRRRPGCCRGRHRRRRPIPPGSWRMCGSRCTRRRSWRTRRGWTRSSRVRRSTAGTSMWVRWRGSGGVGASSGRSS